MHTRTQYLGLLLLLGLLAGCTRPGLSSAGRNPVEEATRPWAVTMAPASPLPATPTRGAADSPGELSYDGLDRTYLLHLPPSYDGHTPLPLVLVFHGGLGNAESIAGRIGMEAQADEHGFILVYPNGTGRTERALTWNAGYCCGYAMEHEIDDVGFVRALLDKLQAELAVDPKRVYAAGISNGAMLVYRLAAELPTRFAAVAPVAGAIGGQAQGGPRVLIPEPAYPVSIIAFHGKKDENVPYGGGTGKDALEHRVDMSVAEAIAFWVQADGCDKDPATETMAEGKVVKDSYVNCWSDTNVVLYTIVDGGHEWPGAERKLLERGPVELDATEEMVEFFLRHGKE